MDAGALEAGAGVSILAPRNRGACRGAPVATNFPGTFQSSLPVTGERVLPMSMLASSGAMFQSSLPVTGERVTGNQFTFKGGSGFNPRSP